MRPFRDRRAWRLIVYRYLPWLALLNLAWEAAHVRLYTLWEEAPPVSIAFSVVHCTLGDVLIGGLALVLALLLGREAEFREWRWRRIAALTVAFGAGYTIFSEWLNVTVLRSWVYAEAMPKVNLAGIQIGISPLAQWLVLPPFALCLARLSQHQTRTLHR